MSDKRGTGAVYLTAAGVPRVRDAPRAIRYRHGVEYDLLAIDLDGTLLGPDHLVSSADRAALHQAHEAGLKVVLCTGRALPETRPILDQIGLDLDAAITVGGAVITDLRLGRTIRRREIERTLANEAARWFLDQALATLWLIDADAEGYDGVIIDASRRHEALERWLKQTPCHIREVSGIPDDIAAPVRLTVVDDVAALAGMSARLTAAFDGRLTHNILTAPQYRLSLIEVFAADVNKWTAIEALCERWRIDPSRTVAIGDDVNDVEMVRRAGLGVAMGNACEAVLAVAKRRTTCNTECGVARLVELLLEK